MADKKNPHNGVLVNTWHQGYEDNCSLSVSVLCDANTIQVTFLASPALFFFALITHVLYYLESRFVICSCYIVQGPQSLEKEGKCAYVSF